MNKEWEKHTTEERPAGNSPPYPRNENDWDVLLGKAEIL
jgi:hypothetical protein